MNMVLKKIIKNGGSQKASTEIWNQELQIHDLIMISETVLESLQSSIRLDLGHLDLSCNIAERLNMYMINCYKQDYKGEMTSLLISEQWSISSHLSATNMDYKLYNWSVQEEMLISDNQGIEFEYEEKSAEHHQCPRSAILKRWADWS